MAAPHPYSATVLGIPLRGLASDAERELILSLSETPSTVGIWPVYRLAGATDDQIDVALRMPGCRCSTTSNYAQRPSTHWHWRSNGDTAFWVRGVLEYEGAALIATVRRLLEIPELGGAEPEAWLEPEGLVNGRVPVAALTVVVEDGYAEICRAHQTRGEENGHLVCDQPEDLVIEMQRRYLSEQIRDHYTETPDQIRGEMTELAARAEVLDAAQGDEEEDERESVLERLDYLLGRWLARGLDRAIPAAG